MALQMVRSLVFATALQGAGAVQFVSMRTSGNRSAAEVSDDPSAFSKPHIVIILVDDMGYNGVGYNNDEIKTPHVDKLAKEGVILTSFYAAAICAPSRFSLLTGRNAWKSEGFGSKNLDPAYPVGTDPTYDMLPKVLQAVGYKTHAVGKWHQGFHKPEYLPTARGFDTFFGILEGSSDHFTQSSETWRCGGVPVVDFTIDDEPLTGKDWDKETDLGDTKYHSQAVKIIEAHDAKDPLFLYLALQFPHSPFQVTEDYMDKYDLSVEMKTYYGMISHVDDTVKGVTEALQKTKLWDNTIVVFLSDNGAEALAPETANYPYQGHKGQVLEGGIRVPCFVTGGYVPSKGLGKKLPGLVSIADWSVTFSVLAGATKFLGAGPMPVDGVNVWDYISGGSDTSNRDHVIQLHPNSAWLGGAGSSDGCRTGAPTYSYRTGNWKLVSLGTAEENLVRISKSGHINCDDHPCLFDLEADEKEEHDLSADNPGIVTKLTALVNKELEVAIGSKWFGRVFEEAGESDQDKACIGFDKGDKNYHYIAPWADGEYTSNFVQQSVQCESHLTAV